MILNETAFLFFGILSGDKCSLHWEVLIWIHIHLHSPLQRKLQFLRQKKKSHAQLQNTVWRSQGLRAGSQEEIRWRRRTERHGHSIRIKVRQRERWWGHQGHELKHHLYPLLHPFWLTVHCVYTAYTVILWLWIRAVKVLQWELYPV